MELPATPQDDRQCPKCGHGFRDPSTLRRHLARKRPCATVVDRVELPPENVEGKAFCRFCGRPFSNGWNVRRHLKACPVVARGARGLDDLYAHILGKQRQSAAQKERIAELEAELARERARPAEAPAAPIPQVDVTGEHATIVQLNCVSQVATITVNVFGREETSHISGASVRRILNSCLADDLAGRDAGVARALLQAALLIYSDPNQPENITCHIPNKRDGNALVHGERGWEIQPVPLVLPPMARSSVDLLFEKQPFEDAEQYGDILRRVRDQGLSGGADLRAVLIRNKDLLSRVLSRLPMAGEP